MKSFVILSGVAALAAAQTVSQVQQITAPAPVLLTTLESGVLPVLPKATDGAAFTGIETNEGALIYDGVTNGNFSGRTGNTVVQQNTPGLSFRAILPTINFDPLTNIQGSVTLTVPANGTGVMITHNLTGFPDEAAYGPFMYHIHTLPVPADGNCTATLGHLDPTNRGEYYPCVGQSGPQTCQAGDLSGKHGNITTSSVVGYTYDRFLSTNPASAYYFGNKAIVFHSRNATRLTCANFVQLANSTYITSVSALPTTVTATIPGVTTIVTTLSQTMNATTAVAVAGVQTSSSAVGTSVAGVKTSSAAAAGTSVATYVPGNNAGKNVAGGIVGAAVMAGAWLI